VLFDEPLSNVDAKVREELRFELISLQRKIGFSAVYVTHDQAEAMALADRLILFRDGRIVQSGTPSDVYRRPASEYVARFLGTINALPGTVARRDGDGASVTTPVGDLRVDAPGEMREGDRVVVAWRPEACGRAAEPPSAVNSWPVDVTAALFLGSHHEYLVEAERIEQRVWRMDTVPVAEGERAWLSVAPADLMLFPAGA
jgi:iron(III) transport system ATP-binding protein